MYLAEPPRKAPGGRETVRPPEREHWGIREEQPFADLPFRGITLAEVEKEKTLPCWNRKESGGMV